ncbi:unnamed protein product [Rotaria socialis]|uniref:ADP ribosyltransferase domain-containing protein n=1 Tax=Rotaria socialis TaxID=392032 RepID=A0A817KSN8_9BILA|nr:unnamed protein product [Rotaria socialis]
MVENPFRLVELGEKNSTRNHLAISILCTEPTQLSEYDQFIRYCRLLCKESDELDHISEFELRYNSDQAVQWYTRPSGFPSKLVNRICRTENPRSIWKIRYFLKHLHEQLSQIYQKSLFWLPKSVVVYRGQTLSSQEFQQLVQWNKKTILTTTYLSTTSAYDTAAAFADCDIQSRQSLSKDQISIIFTITLRTKHTRSRPFAYIQEYSHVRDEKEILISIGTIFSCMDICKRGINFYEISLIHDQYEEEMEKNIQYEAIKSYRHPTATTIGDFLMLMNIPSTLDNDFYDQSLISLVERYSQCNLEDVVDLEYRLMNILNLPVDVTPDHLVIWLDTYIGQDYVYIDLKRTLENAIDLNPDGLLTYSKIDALILCKQTNTLPERLIIPVTTIEECLELIDENRHKKIFLISSGTLGQHLVPYVLNSGRSLEKIFIFCHHIANHVDWAMDFTDQLLMCDFHTHLFSRVVYEIGMYYQNQALHFSDSNQHSQALSCLYYCHKQLERANRLFGPPAPYSLITVEQYIEREKLQQFKH